jgi:hypothetical protein
LPKVSKTYAREKTVSSTNGVAKTLKLVEENTEKKSSMTTQS